MTLLVGCKEQIVKSRIACDIVVGGNPERDRTSAGFNALSVTEVQAGGGIFMDPYYRAKYQVPGLDFALTVLTTVVNSPTIERAIIDASP